MFKQSLTFLYNLFYRRDIIANIYDLTQFECMNKLTKAIVNEIKDVTLNLKSLKTENERLKGQLKQIQLNCKSSQKCIKKLENDYKKLQNRQHKGNLKYNNKIAL